MIGLAILMTVGLMASFLFMEDYISSDALDKHIDKLILGPVLWRVLLVLMFFTGACAALCEMDRLDRYDATVKRQAEVIQIDAARKYALTQAAADRALAEKLLNCGVLVPEKVEK